MSSKDKVVRCYIIQAAQLNICDLNFKRIALTFKTICYRLAIWLNTLGAVLL